VRPSTRRRRSHLRIAPLALAAVAALGLLASACGGSSNEGVAQVDSGETTTGADSQGGTGSVEAWAACMRRQGVSPNAEGTPRFDAAKSECARFAPNDDDPPLDPRDRAEQLELVLTYAACMRRNGVPNFPDPESNPDGYVKITPEELTAPGLSPSSPQYQAAEEACEDLAP
jgi:hypothetical protein